MEKNFLEDAICDIMRNDGPDGHTDGSDVIADFIIACLEGDGYSWIANYRNKIDSNKRYGK